MNLLEWIILIPIVLMGLVILGLSFLFLVATPYDSDYH